MLNGTTYIQLTLISHKNHIFVKKVQASEPRFSVIAV